MIDLTRYVEQGLAELRTKTLRQIQFDTALVWCGRAIAAARLGVVDDAIEYAHEAIEHAALSGSDELLGTIREGLRREGVPL